MILNTVELSNLKMLSPALSVLFLCPLYGNIISYVVNNFLEKNEGWNYELIIIISLTTKKF